MKTIRSPKFAVEHFIRLAGMSDALLKKVRIDTDDSAPTLRTGRVVRLTHRFNRYEAAMREYLIAKVTPLESDLAKKLVEFSTLTENLSPPTGSSTKAARTRRKVQQHNTERESNLKVIRESLIECFYSIQGEVDRAESELDQALGRLNEELARYSKATRFGVVEKEIPVIKRTFDPHSVLDETLMAKARSALSIT